MCRVNDESLQKQMMKEDFNKRRNRGRSKKRWTDLIKEDNALPVVTDEKYPKNRKKWTNNVNTEWAKLLSGVCNQVSQSHMRNFVKIKKLILFDSKCSCLGIWARNFRKPMSDLKWSHSKYGTCEISLRLES